ncbi:MAG: rhodanese-like domain-containing protein [Methylococcaceae bacterium]
MNRLFAVLLALLGVNSAASAQNLASVSPTEAASLHAEKKAVIIDVREENEWQAQHIAGAIHIPLGQLEQRLAELKPYQYEKVITQCRSGKRSAQAASVLQAAGFDKVYNMEGGLMAWEKQGLKVE